MLFKKTSQKLVNSVKEDAIPVLNVLNYLKGNLQNSVPTENLKFDIFVLF